MKIQKMKEKRFDANTPYRKIRLIEASDYNRKQKKEKQNGYPFGWNGRVASCTWDVACGFLVHLQNHIVPNSKRHKISKSVYFLPKRQSLYTSDPKHELVQVQIKTIWDRAAPKLIVNWNHKMKTCLTAKKFIYYYVLVIYEGYPKNEFVTLIKSQKN